VNNHILLDTANQYLLSDIENAAIPGAQLAIILEKLNSKEKITDELLEFLNRGGFVALYLFAKGEILFADYLSLAQEEQDERRIAIEKEARRIKFLAEAEEAERERRDNVRKTHERYEREKSALIEQQRSRILERRAQMKDPRYQAKIREKELRREYGLDAFVDPKNYHKIIEILNKLDNGSRISKDELNWLSTEEDENYECYLTDELAKRYHYIEAEHFSAEFKRTGDLWQAVNASGHFRKCEEPRHAELLLDSIKISPVITAKLHSALCTTHGGVKRDLHKFDHALKLAIRAHELTPNDFRPCTLLGAIHYEQGDYEQGKKWYDEAIKRGFKESQVDKELKMIFRRLGRVKQVEMRQHLLSLDQERYEWVNKWGF
jgi:tetratricopeptide (TPR) repeat protein